MKNGVWLIVVLVVIAVFGFFYLQSSKNSLKNTPNYYASPTTSTSQNSPQGTPQNDTSNVKDIPLEVAFPLDGSNLSQSPVIVKGKTLSNAAVFVNENELKADASGNFSSAVDLDEGESTIFVVANDPRGNFSEKDITVNFTPQ